MNVDLNWCPCGKQSREDSMYCSDACYLKDLSSSGSSTLINGFTRYGKNLKRDSFFTSNHSHTHHCEKKNTLKVPDFRNPYDSFVLSASTNLAFKNRQKYHQNSYYTKNSYMYNTSNNSSTMASSYGSTTSTIDDYFKKPTTAHLKVEDSPKPSTVIIAPSKSENAKEKSNNKCSSSRSSYVIEAVYPVQNFNKNSIAVY